MARGRGPSKVLIGGPAPAVLDKVPPLLVLEAVRAAWPGRPVAGAETVRSDQFLSRAEGLSGGTRLVRLTRPDLRLYLDGVSGEILVVMDRSREAYAWFYYALHTWNVPGLSERPMLRIVLLFIPLLAGFLLSITGMVVGLRRLASSRPFQGRR